MKKYFVLFCLSVFSLVGYAGCYPHFSYPVGTQFLVDARNISASNFGMNILPSQAKFYSAKVVSGTANRMTDKSNDNDGFFNLCNSPVIIITFDSSNISVDDVHVVNILPCDAEERCAGWGHQEFTHDICFKTSTNNWEAIEWCPGNYSQSGIGEYLVLNADGSAYSGQKLMGNICGSCGNNIEWLMKCWDDKSLELIGSGKIDDFSNQHSSPWYSWKDSIQAIIVPEGITSIGDYAFCDIAIKSINLPNSVQDVGYKAFAGCGYLTAPIYNTNVFAYLPTSYSGVYSVNEGIKVIAGGAMSGCEDLSQIKIPSSVTSIKSDAFEECSNVTDIYCYATTPPAAPDDVFNATGQFTTTLHVPSTAVNMYRVALGWRYFYNIVALDDSPINEVHLDSPLPQKVLKDEQIFIQRANKTYDPRGQEVN